MNIPLSELDTVLGYALPEDEKDKDKKPAPTAAAKPAPSMPAPGQANALPIGPQLPAPPRNVSLQDANTLPGMHQPTPHTTSVSPAEAQAPALPAPQAPALPGPASGIPTLQAPTKKESQAAGKLEYQEGLSAAPANAGVLPGDKVGADMATNAYEKKHPLGSDVSAKPGGWGKFEHGLSVAGNIAGDIVAPGIMEGIPGTDANKMLTERRDSQWEKLNADNSLKAAQTGQAKAAAWKDYNNPGLLGKTNDEQDMASLQGKINPDTGQVYTTDEINQHIKQQSQDVKPTLEQNTPVGDAGVAQHAAQLQQLEVGGGATQMTPAQKAQFEQAYAAKPGDTQAVVRQRLEDAKQAAGLRAGELDRQLQRDIATSNGKQAEADRQQRITDSERTHADSEADKAKIAADKLRKPMQDTVNAYHEAGELANQNTGPGDYGLTMRFVEATKPSTGFRFTNTELQLIQSRRGLVDAANARMGGVTTGVMYDAHQRQQMLDVMRLRADMDSARLAWMNGTDANGKPNDINRFGSGPIPKDVAAFYRDAAGKNNAAAMAMAKQDGWTF